MNKYKYIESNYEEYRPISIDTEVVAIESV